MLAVHLVGTLLAHILGGAPVAQGLGLVAVDVEETAAVVGGHGILYLVLQEGISLLL